MGMKNVSGVRKVVRGGKPRWILDFRYTDKDGVRQRFRRDAGVQGYAAAVAEAARLMNNPGQHAGQLAGNEPSVLRVGPFFPMN